MLMYLLSNNRWVIATLLWALCNGAALGNPAKLDARLRSVAEITTRAQYHIMSQTQPLMEATLRFSGQGLDDLRALGVEIRSVLGDVATVAMARNQLADVAALPHIQRIEAPRRPVIRLDQSVPATRADLLRSGENPANWIGGTGQGVLVGLIDTGVDIAHPDFRQPDGASRVLYLWNQRDDAVGTAPTGDDGTPLYGAECDATMIDQALKDTHHNACKMTDSYGHGTHVAGIAAGNGQASGNDKPFYRFVGMAPKADLMVVNALDDGVSHENSVLDAVAFMVRKAKALHRPLVINLSLGSYYGPRDGTSTLERALDNASGPGIIIVAAVGNQGMAPIRAAGSMAPGQTVQIGFDMPSWKSWQQMEGWYDGANKYDVAISCNGFTTPVVAAGDHATHETPCGLVEVISTAVNPENADRQILINFGDDTAYLQPGKWTLNLTARLAGGDFSFISGESEDDINFTSHVPTPYTSEIITDMASARRVISVAAYNTRSSWESTRGTTTLTDSGPMGDLCNFSSRGPRRMCSNASLCPPVMKPEITAPGAYVISAYTSAGLWLGSPDMIEADGVHVAYSGTSMATPHVTGAIALLMQASPLLTPEDAKRILANSVQGNAFTAASPLPRFDGADLPPEPNYAWGYGILDAAAAFRSHTGYSIPSGWNLLGNTLDVPFDVAGLVGSASHDVAGVSDHITSMWQWQDVGGNGQWAFYAPAMNASQLATYASNKGYSVLKQIMPGEGFWVNALQPVTLPVSGGAAYGLSSSNLVPHWNLVATGIDTTPSGLNGILGDAMQDNFITLWAWDNPSKQWFFYAPDLDRQGELNSYLANKGYLDFATDNKKLGHGLGFWINR